MCTSEPIVCPACREQDVSWYDACPHWRHEKELIDLRTETANLHVELNSAKKRLSEIEFERWAWCSKCDIQLIGPRGLVCGTCHSDTYTITIADLVARLSERAEKIKYKQADDGTFMKQLWSYLINNHRSGEDIHQDIQSLLHLTEEALDMLIEWDLYEGKDNSLGRDTRELINKIEDARRNKKK